MPRCHLDIARLLMLAMLAVPVAALAQPVNRFELKTDADKYVIGAPLTLKVTAPESDKSVHLYIVSNNGDPQHVRRIYSGDAANGLVIDTAAPSEPGRHEYQLRTDDQIHARAAFATEVTRTPGAIVLPKTTFRAGETFELNIKLPKGRYYGDARFGICSVGERAPGGAALAPYWHSWVYVGKGKHTIAAPSEPGKYEVRLFDRNAGYYEIDAASFDVIIEKAPGAIKLSKSVYRAGEKMSIRVDFPKNRYYGSPRLSVHRKAEIAPGGAEVDAEGIHWIYVNDGLVELNAPHQPGTYGVSVFDRNGGSYLIDSCEFSVIVEPTPGALQLERKRFVIGSQISVKVTLPQDRYYGSPVIWLSSVNREVAGGAVAVGDGIAKQYVDVSSDKPHTFTAPATPGEYELRLYDRNSHYFLLDRVRIEVGVTRVRDMISIDKAEVTPGQKVTITLRPPADRYYGTPVVHLMRQGYEVAGGARAAERFISKWYFDPADRQTHSITFDAPKEAGEYELRVLDRNSHYYILDATPLTVTARGQVNLALGESRETPLPGDDEGLPPPANRNTIDIDNGPRSGFDRTENEAAAVAMGKKAADFYMDLEELLKKPQDEWTEADARRMAGHLVGMLPDRFEALQTFFETNTQRIDDLNLVIELARDAWYILNPDPDDDLWELRAFHKYLGMMRRIADKVPGVGQFYGQYVDAVGGIINSAETINEARKRTNNAIELWDDVLAGTYKTAPQRREALDREFDHFLGGAERMRSRAAEEMTDADAVNINAALAGVERPWRNVVFDIRSQMETLDQAYRDLKEVVDLTAARQRQAARRSTTVEKLYSVEQLQETRRDLIAARHRVATARSLISRLEARERPLRLAYLEKYHYYRSLALSRSRPELQRLGSEELLRRAREQARQESDLPLSEMFRYGVMLPQVRPNPEQM